MGSQGFRNIAGNPFVYQEDTRSAAFGLDLSAQKWKLSVKATAGALPTDTAQFSIDPATNGDVTIDPNGSGNLVVTSGNVSLTSGNLALPTCSATVGRITTNGNSFIQNRGTYNLFVGELAGNLTFDTTYSTRNTGIGYGALKSINGNASAGQEGNWNTTLGFDSLSALTTGTVNTSFGPLCFAQLVSGSWNCGFGYGTGYDYASSETGNVLIGPNIRGTAGESNVIRIGSTGANPWNQSKAYIAGIYGVTPGGTINIALVDSNGQLGSTATLSPSLGGAMPWTEVTGTSQAAAVNNGYITNNGSLVTVTLPSTAAVGQRVAIVGKGAGLWKLAQNSGQTIHFGSVDSTTGTGGYLSATVKYDCLEVICITADTDWVVRDSVGSITIV